MSASRPASHPPRLSLDIKSIIALLGGDLYQQLLALPSFARSTLTRQTFWKDHLVIRIVTKDNHRVFLKHSVTINVRHCNDKPACITYDNEGNVVCEEWYNYDTAHRTALVNGKVGPTYTVYRLGKVIKEAWSCHNRLHNKNGPAVIYYNGDGTVNEEMWFYHDCRHRIDGPARTMNPSIPGHEQLQYFLLGKEYTKEEYDFAIAVLAKIISNE
jgi:hypothetical protein